MVGRVIHCCFYWSINLFRIPQNFIISYNLSLRVLSQWKSDLFLRFIPGFFQQSFNCKNLVCIWLSCSKSCLVFTKYIISIFLKSTVKIMVIILYPMRNNDILLQLWHSYLSPLFNAYIGTMKCVPLRMHPPYSHILLFKLCSIYISSCHPF